MTYSAPLRVDVELRVKETEEIKEQQLFMGDFPLMTKNGTFIINGAERVVVSQLVRSPGVYFTVEQDPSSGRDMTGAKLIPNRGAWLEFETSNKDIVSVKVDRKRKIPITTLLRAIDRDPAIDDETKLGTDERILTKFEDVESLSEIHHYIRTTLERDSARTKRQALEEFYKRLRPGDPPTLENARQLLDSLFFNPRRYDLGRVGRYKLNKRLGVSVDQKTRTLTHDDIVSIVKQLIRINLGQGLPDDIDHLGNRRVRAVGELIQNQFRIGLLRMERVVRERMTITDPDQATPSALINIRPVVAAMKEFFGGSQLSQFMDQTNPLAELTHKRRLSALGPGGLSRDRAGFDRARRASQPLRTYLPDRDSGRSEHRPDWLAGDVWQGEPIWLHRNTISQSPARAAEGQRRPRRTHTARRFARRQGRYRRCRYGGLARSREENRIQRRRAGQGAAVRIRYRRIPFGRRRRQLRRRAG